MQMHFPNYLHLKLLKIDLSSLEKTDFSWNTPPTAKIWSFLMFSAHFHPRNTSLLLITWKKIVCYRQNLKKAKTLQIYTISPIFAQFLKNNMKKLTKTGQFQQNLLFSTVQSQKSCSQSTFQILTSAQYWPHYSINLGPKIALCYTKVKHS